MATRSDVLAWRGQDALDADGDKIGSIEEIYLDAETDEPEWALVNTGMFGTKRSFVPLRNAAPSDGEGVRVPFDKATVKDAPKVDPDGRLSHDEETELYRHYGLENGGADTAPASTGRRDSGEGSGDAMTRSEEELDVGTSRRETGRARLKKYVVEDEVTQTVPVRREEVRIEREPVTDANRDDALSGAEISEAEHEVVLHEEEPVTEKRTVPKERVRLGKDVHEDEHEISETVRKERIDVDDSGTR
jgi:uncharacterized protein (TIGR02271 family)